MPRISIITAAYEPRSQFLSETAASVARQTLPSGWDLEWIVQEDGPTPLLDRTLSSHPFVEYQSNHGQLGIAATRNLALSRATGALVQVLDHDDVLLPSALETLIAVFDGSDTVHWAVGQADDLMPDGTRHAYPPGLPFGVVPAGTANRWAVEHQGNWPVHCAGLMMRTATVRALGGWAGIPAEDDISLFAALAEITDGYFHQATTWLYRQHDQQTFRSAAWRARSSAGRRIALQRAAAIRLTGMRPLSTPLANSGNGDVGTIGPSKTPRVI